MGLCAQHWSASRALGTLLFCPHLAHIWAFSGILFQARSWHHSEFSLSQIASQDEESCCRVLLPDHHPWRWLPTSLGALGTCECLCGDSLHRGVYVGWHQAAWGRIVSGCMHAQVCSVSTAGLRFRKGVILTLDSWREGKEELVQSVETKGES